MESGEIRKNTRLNIYSDEEVQGSLFSGQSGPFSARSRGTILEDRAVTFQDIKSIMPTVLILIFTLLIMVTVIPYAFSNVIKQLQAVRLLEQQQEEAAAAAAAAALVTPKDSVLLASDVTDPI